MLCRPMTAAGFGLPFGLWYAWLATACSASCAKTTPTAARSPCSATARCVPWPGRWSLGLAALFLYNRAITGNGLFSPYQLYTDTYTPRHVYGFNNVERGQEQLGPKVLDNYDRWAKNLTPHLALANESSAGASARWTLGLYRSRWRP